MVIGFAPYSTASVLSARAAHESGATLVAIADAITAPMAEGADHLLLYEAAASPGFFPSLTGAIAIAQSLAAVTFVLGGAAQSGASRRPKAGWPRCRNMLPRRVDRHGVKRAGCCIEACVKPLPRAIGGEGVWLIGEDGRRILDASGGAAVSCLGHQHPRVLEAMSRQASKLAYAHTGFFSSEPAEALADKLVGHEPGGLGYAYFVSGGSEAIEAGIKLARQYFIELGEPQRQRFIARRQSYHGNTLGALAAGGNAWRREPYAPLLSSAFSHVTPAFAYHEKRDSESEADFVARLAAELEAEFQRLGPETVAAFIAEPVVGATAGCVPAPEGYFRAVREICDRHGALLILDEVMCGMGRTGTRHAWEQEGIAPDIQAIAKGLGGGYQPIGAMLASGRIIDAIRDGSGAFQHGHTYLAHPLACAAALEVQRVIRTSNCSTG